MDSASRAPILPVAEPSSGSGDPSLDNFSPLSCWETRVPGYGKYRGITGVMTGSGRAGVRGGVGGWVPREQES